MQKLFDLISHFIDEIKQFFDLVTDAVSTLTHLVSILPTWLTVFAGITLTALIIMQVLGRDNGGD